MVYSVKVRILCIFVLFSLVHLSQADNNTIKVLKRIEKQLSEFKRKYENEQQRIREFVSLSLKEFQDQGCYNATIETFVHKNDYDPFGNIHISIIELDVASLLSDSGKLCEPTVGTPEKQGCECEKACAIIRQDITNCTNQQTNRLTDELRSQFEMQQKSYEEANTKIDKTHQNMLDSLSMSQDTSVQIRNTLDKLEALTLSQNNSIEELAKRLSNDLKTQFETQKKSFPKGLANLYNDCDCAIANGNISGVYQVLISNKVASVYCDAFGRMMIQHQMEGPADFFNRTWSDYQHGFGAPHAQYWMGLEYVYLLTSSRRYELHLLLVDFKNVTTLVIYDHFQIGDASNSFRLNKLGVFSGNETDNQLQKHINLPFSTYDERRIEDQVNCPKYYNCGWWYFPINSDRCTYVNFNKRVRSNDGERHNDVMTWDENELKEVSMYIKLH